MAILLLVVGILLFISLIIVHEYGHFITARRNGVEVEEFGIFFPPRLYKRKTKGGWDFTINALPLGGFVRLKGEHDSDTEPGTFGAASVWVKSKIMVAGVIMNLIAALVLFTIIALIGMPKIVPDQFTVQSDTKVVSSQALIGHVEPGSPAAKAGLQSLDKLQDFTPPGHTPIIIDKASSLDRSVSKKFAGQTVIIRYERDNQLRQAKVTLRSAAEVAASEKANPERPKAYLGIEVRDYGVQRSTWSAPVVAVGLSAQLTSLTMQGLGNALSGLGGLIAGGVTGNQEARQEGQTKASEQVTGPVGIFAILQDGSVIGYHYMLFIIAYISLSLAIMNILPIPAMDGGRLWLTLVSRGFKRPLTARQEELVNASGFFLLIGLFIVITFVDVKRFF